MSREKQSEELTTDSEEFEKARKRAAEMVGQMQKKIETEDDTMALFKPLPPETLDEKYLIKPLEPGDMMEQFLPKKRVDVYNQMQEQADEFIKLLQEQEQAVETEAKPDEEAEVEEDAEAETKIELGDETAQALSKARAKDILGKHKTFASYSKDKFNYYMRQAEERLKEGRYYSAADSYTMANVFKADDPLAFAGKSHALFAAGEYLSSSLYLSRAIETFPEYVMFKVDLAAMIPDKDVLENRIIEATEWQDKSNSAELQFLLGYVYYQLDKINEAKMAIDSAVEKMPESKAAAILKKVIYSTGK